MNAAARHGPAPSPARLAEHHGLRIAALRSAAGWGFIPSDLHALLEGYAAVRPLPSGVERQIDLFIELRMLNAIEWVLDCWPSVDERPWGRAFLQRAGEFFGDD